MSARIGRLVRASLLPVVLLSGAWLYAGSGERHVYAGTPLRVSIAPVLKLPDDHGGLFDLTAHRGRLVLVSFGYTHCPDICPATLGLMDAAIQRLGADAQRVDLVFVTLDPARDTPGPLRAYLANFDPAPIGLSGTPEAVAAATQAWGVTVRSQQGGAYFDHTSLVAVVGPDGRERLRYSFSQLGNSAAVADDLRRILHEG